MSLNIRFSLVCTLTQKKQNNVAISLQSNLCTTAITMVSFQQKRSNNSQFSWNFAQTSLATKQDFFVKITFSFFSFSRVLILISRFLNCYWEAQKSSDPKKIHTVKPDTKTKLFCKNNFALNSFSKELDF
jgi:hypothetical protein